MQRRQGDAKTQALIVREGLKGKAVAEICTEHQISQSQYYQWRDQFLANAAQAFEVHQHTCREAHLEHEHSRLKKLVGERTLKKKRRTPGMTRQRALRVSQCAERLLPRIRALKAEHPFWGYRRLWAYLRCVEHQPINTKRIWRLMREHQLLVQPRRRLQAKRTPTRSKPKPTRPNAWWGIDMTKVLVEGVGWVYIVIVRAWDTKKLVGFQAGLRGTAPQWLEAVDRAVNTQFPHGTPGHGLALMSANGCQPTSGAFLEACRAVEIRQAFTSDNNPKGNADTERVMRTLKEECLWRREWTCPFALRTTLERWITTYHAQYLHSALGYKTPRQFAQDHDTSPSPPFLAA